MDPIFELNGLWYFWDETWSTSFGPFDSKVTAREKLFEYINQFLESPNGESKEL